MARARHFGAFYGLEPMPVGGPLLVVHGNCQAESLRLALAGDDLATVRVPPVHELTARDLPALHRVLARAAVLVTQPVRDDYRGLPLGSGQLAGRLSPAARLIRVPVVRFAGLYPAQAIIRPPSDRGAVPPVVPYHDLRVLAEAARLPPRPERIRAAAVRAIAEQSRTALRARERAHRTLVVSDLFDIPSFGQMRTINHPGNPVWETVAGRVRDELGLRPAQGLDRPLLDRVHAPREPGVIEAFGLDDMPRAHWRVDDRPVDPAELRAAHLAWYRDHPDAVADGLRRHAETLEILAGR